MSQKSADLINIAAAAWNQRQNVSTDEDEGKRSLETSEQMTHCHSVTFQTTGIVKYRCESLKTRTDRTQCDRRVWECDS
jgi:hypothetical protein